MEAMHNLERLGMGMEAGLADLGKDWAAFVGGEVIVCMGFVALVLV